jgi:hypothetical protein
LNALFEKQPKNQRAEIDHFVMAITPGGVELAQPQTTTQGWRRGSTGTAARGHGEVAPAMRAGAGNSVPIRKGRNHGRSNRAKIKPGFPE